MTSTRRPASCQRRPTLSPRRSDSHRFGHSRRARSGCGRLSRPVGCRSLRRIERPGRTQLEMLPGREHRLPPLTDHEEAGVVEPIEHDRGAGRRGEHLAIDLLPLGESAVRWMARSSRSRCRACRR